MGMGQRRNHISEVKAVRNLELYVVSDQEPAIEAQR